MIWKTVSSIQFFIFNFLSSEFLFLCYTFRRLRLRINPVHLLQRPPFSGRILSPDYGFRHSLCNLCQSVLNVITHSQYMFHLILKRSKHIFPLFDFLYRFLYTWYFFHEVYGIRPNFIPVGNRLSHLIRLSITPILPISFSHCVRILTRSIDKAKGNSCGKPVFPTVWNWISIVFCHIVHWNHRHFLTDYQRYLSRQSRLICCPYHSTAPIFCQLIFSKKYIFLLYSLSVLF